jgi:hypothetical protein
MEVRAGQYWPITLRKLVAFHIDFGHVHIDGEGALSVVPSLR